LVDIIFFFFSRDTKSLFDGSSVVDTKFELPQYRDVESPPPSPRKRGRPVYTVDSYDSKEGRSVEELKTAIKRVLTSKFQAFEEVGRIHVLIYLQICLLTSSSERASASCSEKIHLKIHYTFARAPHSHVPTLLFPPPSPLVKRKL
jgi:hypothetical protein